MFDKKGYKSRTLSFNRKMVAASASVNKRKNIIHSMAEVDISMPLNLIQAYYDKTKEKLSLTAYIVKCLAFTLKDFPDFNSFIKGNKLIVLDVVTVSVLIERYLEGENVPEPIGIHHVQDKDFLQIHKEIRETKNLKTSKLGESSGQRWINYIKWIPAFFLRFVIRIADKNIKLAKEYGKVAVTSVGMFSKNPIWFIPHGSATVLVTVGSINKKTVEIDDCFVSREHLCLTVSFDHDIIDGAPASRFMNQFIENIKSGDLMQIN